MELMKASYREVLPGEKVWHRRRKAEGGAYVRVVKKVLNEDSYEATNGMRYSFKNAYIIARR